MKELINLPLTASAGTVPCAAGQEVRIIGVRYQVAAGSVAYSQVALGQPGGVALISTCGFEASTQQCVHGIGLTQTIIDPTLTGNQIVATAGLPEMWWPFEVAVVITGSSGGWMVMYERRSRASARART